MIKNLSFLLILSVALFSCESESFDESTVTIENDTTIDPNTDDEKITDEYNDPNRGL